MGNVTLFRIFEKYEDYIVKCKECEMRTYQLMDNLEILFYAYGLMSVAIPGDVSDEDMARMKFFLSEGRYFIEDIEKMVEILHRQEGDFEATLCEIERQIVQFMKAASLPERIVEQTEAMVNHVDEFCPHAGSSNGVRNAAQLVQESIRVYRNAFEELIDGGKKMIEELRLRYDEFVKFLEF